jgi:octaprenyl-diphosphate synthase
MGVQLTPQDIYQLVASDLVKVEEELQSYAYSSIRPIADIGEHLLNAGGKRIRPALLLLTGKMLGGVTPSMIRLAAVVELIHNATLVHDDIIDDADTRRGIPSVNVQWGNSMTVLAGDWLYMQSFYVALGEKNLEILATLIEITQQMVEGEMLQLTMLGKTGIQRGQLLDIVKRKTAFLFAGCMKLPAIAAALDANTTNCLASIGMNLGMAFQLVDDLLDLTATRESLGKPVAGDLKEGKLTLPVSFAIGDGDTDALLKVQTVMSERGFDSVRSGEILSLVEKSDGLGQTRRMAEDFVRQARQSLENFPASVYRDAIIAIPDFILNRKV